MRSRRDRSDRPSRDVDEPVGCVGYHVTEQMRDVSGYGCKIPVGAGWVGVSIANEIQKTINNRFPQSVRQFISTQSPIGYKYEVTQNHQQ